jgi:hypothetical protein
MKKEKIVWTYKSLKNETPKKFIIIHEYAIDAKTSAESGTVAFGMEDEKMIVIDYTGAEKSAEIVHKISMDAVKKGFVIEKLEDGTNTFEADENALIEEDEEFWNGKKNIE